MSTPTGRREALEVLTRRGLSQRMLLSGAKLSGGDLYAQATGEGSEPMVSG